MNKTYLFSIAVFITHLVLYLSKDAIRMYLENGKIYISGLEDSLNNITI